MIDDGSIIVCFCRLGFSFFITKRLYLLIFFFFSFLIVGNHFFIFYFKFLIFYSRNSRGESLASRPPSRVRRPSQNHFPRDLTFYPKQRFKFCERARTKNRDRKKQKTMPIFFKFKFILVTAFLFIKIR